MAKHYASGTWKVKDGKDGAFIEAWTKFLTWTRDTQPGLEFARLLHDEKDPRHFRSIAEWKDAKAREAWRNEEQFVTLLGACRELCDDFHPEDYEVAVTI